MKHKFIILTIFIACFIVYFIFDYEGMENLNNDISIESINKVEKSQVNDIKSKRKSCNYDLVNLKYKNTNIAYDKETNQYFFPRSNGDYKFNVFYSDKTIVKKISEENSKIELIAYNKTKFRVYTIILTDLPIISIENDNKDPDVPVTERYSTGLVTIFNNKNTKKSIDLIEHFAKLKIRGGSSRYEEKKSYLINFIEPKSSKDLVVEDIFNMKGNYQYALNSLYDDPSKIRDKLSFDIWKNINSKYMKSKNIDNDIDMEYSEVFINGYYYGLYGFQEVPNEYTLGINNTENIAYKVSNHIVPKLYEFNDNSRNCQGISIIYPKYVNSEIWDPLKNVIELIYYSDDKKFNNEILKYIDIDNCVNYFILLELLYAQDNCWKNGIFTYYNNNGKLIRTPWDLDLTWGNTWLGESSIEKKLLINSNEEYLQVYLEKRLWNNNVDNFREKVSIRWNELRQETLSESSLKNRADTLYEYISQDIRNRDKSKWPDSPNSFENSYIDNYIEKRLKYIDSVMENNS